MSNETNSSKPNYMRRRITAMGIATVLAGLGVFEAKQAVDTHNVTAGIKDAGSHAVADYNDGKLNRDDVVKLKASESGKASEVAQDFANADTDPRELEDTIVAEAGTDIVEGEELIVPRDEVKTSLLPKVEPGELQVDHGIQEAGGVKFQNGQPMLPADQQPQQQPPVDLHSVHVG